MMLEVVIRIMALEISDFVIILIIGFDLSQIWMVTLFQKGILQ